MVCRNAVRHVAMTCLHQLRNQLVEILGRLKRIKNGSDVDDELLSTMQLIVTTLNVLKGSENDRRKMTALHLLVQMQDSQAIICYFFLITFAT